MPGGPLQVAGVIAAEQPRHEQLEHAACEEARRAIDHDTTMTPGLQVLRGGFGVIGISGGNNIKSSSSQSNLGAGGGVALGGSGTSASSGASTPRGGTAFTKIVYSKVPGEIPKTVEVAGSWSKFKQRNSMTKNAQGSSTRCCHATGALGMLLSRWNRFFKTCRDGLSGTSSALFLLCFPCTRVFPEPEWEEDSKQQSVAVCRAHGTWSWQAILKSSWSCRAGSTKLNLSSTATRGAATRTWRRAAIRMYGPAPV